MRVLRAAGVAADEVTRLDGADLVLASWRPRRRVADDGPGAGPGRAVDTGSDTATVCQPDQGPVRLEQL